MKTSSTVVKYFKNIKGLICLFIAICYGLDGMSQSIPFPSNPIINLGTFHSNTDTSQRYILNTDAFLAHMTATDTLESVFKVYVNNQLLDSLSPMKRLPVEIPKSLLHAGNNDIQIDMMLGNNLNILAQTQQFSLFVCESYALSLTSSPTSPVAFGTPVTITANLGLSPNMGTQFTYNWSSNNNTTLTPSTSINNNISVATNLMPSFNSISVTIIDENGCTGVGNIVLEVTCNVNGIDIENYEYSNETTISNGVFISKQDIIVKKGATLNIRNSTIYFYACTRLIVERGARLIVDKSTLTTCDNFTWLGIEAHGTNFSDRNPSNNFINGSAYVEIRNESLISKADIGILAGKREMNFKIYLQDFGGAILNISNSAFQYNRTHIAFTQFQYDNKSKISGNKFLDFYPTIGVPISYCFIENTDGNDHILNLVTNNFYNHPAVPQNLLFSNIDFTSNLNQKLIYVCGNKDIEFSNNRYINFIGPTNLIGSIVEKYGFINVISSSKITFLKEKIEGNIRYYSSGSVSNSAQVDFMECVFQSGQQLNQTSGFELQYIDCNDVRIDANKFLNNGVECNILITKKTSINSNPSNFIIENNEFVSNNVTSSSVTLIDINNVSISKNTFLGNQNNCIHSGGCANINIADNDFHANVNNNYVVLQFLQNGSITGNTTLPNNAFGSNSILIDKSSIVTISKNQLMANGFNGNGSCISVGTSQLLGSQQNNSSNINILENSIGGRNYQKAIHLQQVSDFSIEENDIRSECETGIFILKSSGTGNSVTPYSRLTSNSIKSGRMQNGIHISNAKDIFLSRTFIDIENPLRFDPEQLAYYGFSPLMTTGFGIQLTNQSENVVIQNSPLIKSSHCGVGYFNGIPTRNDNWLDHNIINECDYGLLISYFKDPTLFTYPTQQTAKHRLKTFCNTFNTRIADIIGYGDWVDQGSTNVNPSNTFTSIPNHPNISWYNTASNPFDYYGTANLHSSIFEVHKQSSIFSLPTLYAKHGLTNGSFQATSIVNENCSNVSIKPSYYRSSNVSIQNLYYVTNYFKIFPNPTIRHVEISSKSILKQVTLFDIQGKVRKDFREINKETLEIDLDGLVNGVYLAKIVDSNNHIIMEKIIKNE